jgi:hypothetical protein
MFPVAMPPALALASTLRMQDTLQLYFAASMGPNPVGSRFVYVPLHLSRTSRRIASRSSLVNSRPAFPIILMFVWKMSTLVCRVQMQSFPLKNALF